MNKRQRANKRLRSQKPQKQRDVNKRRKRSTRRTNQLGGIDIPYINNKPIQTRCMRYIQQATVLQTSPSIFTSDDLRQMIGFVTSGATTYYPLIDSIRLLRVGLTVLSDTDTIGDYYGFSWKGTNVPDILEVMYYSYGVPLNRSFYPPPDSSSDWWYDSASTSNALFQIESSATNIPMCFVDIEVQYILTTGAVTSTGPITAPSFTGVGYRDLPLSTSDYKAALLDRVG